MWRLFQYLNSPVQRTLLYLNTSNLARIDMIILCVLYHFRMELIKRMNVHIFHDGANGGPRVGISTLDSAAALLQMCVLWGQGSQNDVRLLLLLLKAFLLGFV